MPRNLFVELGVVTDWDFSGLFSQTPSGQRKYGVEKNPVVRASITPGRQTHSGPSRYRVRAALGSCGSSRNVFLAVPFVAHVARGP